MFQMKTFCSSAQGYVASGAGASIQSSEKANGIQNERTNDIWESILLFSLGFENKGVYKEEPDASLKCYE